MKRLLFLLLFIPAFALGQSVYTYGGDVVRYSDNVLTYTAPIYCVEYQAVYDVFTTPPSDDIAAAQNTMVEALVDNGVWIKLDIFYVFAQSTNGGNEALKNWKLPGTYDCTLANAPTFTALEGFTGNGTTQSINTNWKPLSNGVNYTQNNASAGVYVRNNIARAEFEFGAVSPTNIGNTVLETRRNDNYMIGRLNQGGGDDYVASTDSRGMWIINRVISTSAVYYRNKGVFKVGSTASTGLIDLDFYLLGYNSNGAPAALSTKQISMFFTGGGLTQGDIDNLTNAFETYMDSNSKGVISETFYLLLLCIIMARKKQKRTK